MTSHSCFAGAIVRAVVVNARVVRKGFRGDRVRRKDMCLLLCRWSFWELDRCGSDVAIAMSAIESGLEGNYSLSFGRGIVRPMDLREREVHVHGNTPSRMSAVTKAGL